MNVTRRGKIARLSKATRDALGNRIENGEPGKDLVQWLNGLSAVRKILKRHFEGRPLTEQNLSEWKQGGHLDWLRQQEARALVSRLAEQSEDIVQEAGLWEVSDRFASLLAVELTRLATALMEKETDLEKRWLRLCEVHRELSRLRRDDHHAARALIARKDHVRKTDREDHDDLKQYETEERARLCGQLMAAAQLNPMAQALGGGDFARRFAACFLETQSGLAPGKLSDEPDPAPPPPESPDPA